jgi:hypothetical protein
VVDPDELWLVAWELQEDEYAQAADVVGEDEWVASRPYAVTIRPARLLSCAGLGSRCSVPPRR